MYLESTCLSALLMSSRMQLAALPLSCMPLVSQHTCPFWQSNRFTTAKVIDTCKSPDKYIYFPDDFYPVVNGDINGSFHSKYIIDEEGKIASHSKSCHFLGTPNTNIIYSIMELLQNQKHQYWQKIPKNRIQLAPSSSPGTFPRKNRPASNLLYRPPQRPRRFSDQKVTILLPPRQREPIHLAHDPLSPSKVSLR